MEKTIKTSIIGLTKTKKELLDNDYFNYQWWMLFGIDKGLLSCFKAAKGCELLGTKVPSVIR